MATTYKVGSNFPTGRDYSTFALAFAAVPSTPSGGYILDLYNDSDSFTSRIAITGKTTGPTDFITLRAAATQSFQDQAGVRTNPLFFDQTKGVAIHADAFNTGVISLDLDYVTIERLQIKADSGGYVISTIDVPTNIWSHSIIKDCIIVKAHPRATPIVTLRAAKMYNCLLVNTNATTGDGVLLRSNYGVERGDVINCTIVNTAAAGGTGITCFGPSSVNNIINNTAVFGYTTASSGALQTGNYNATNLASGLPGANSQFNLTTANQFTNVASDFRLKAGANLINGGSTDATNAPADISGYARGAGTLGDIGAWEATATGPAIPVMTNQYRRRR